ncbi:hypothetical protein [Pedobacter sandarakinus]|uniref:hypothetical protein n=1 Tax=Pedobacter sandarakinus TaxID=353156 RepID=UPI0022468C6C|nr:hypothetical protein [Pedobacter sandarakinus]MCX2572910.1 hypothetical protein [Pedobacter sandarakinus]
MMKRLILAFMVCLGLACSDASQKKVTDVIDDTSDSVSNKVDEFVDTINSVKDDIKNKIPKVAITVTKNIPISLQWISFEKQGTAEVTKTKEGVYSIKGEQTNANNEYLKINGTLKRTDATHFAFEGTIITYVKANNSGVPCEKKGKQVFLKKGSRNYYRLQDMENCEGGNVVDYVDLYDLDGLE